MNSDGERYYEVIVTVSLCNMRRLPIINATKNGDKTRNVCDQITNYKASRVLVTRDFQVQKTVFDELQKQQNRTVFTEDGEDL